MKFSTTIISIAALLTSAEACKCLSSIGINEPATRACCQAAGGPANGSDCPAGEISNKLSTFAQCCRSYGTRSDCRCPIGCARKELEAQHKAEGKAPPTEAEIKGLLSKYED
ncbi:hypothetical protein PCL_05354 [Purpureocillium lilacinum]|uniref:Uncharacterized protein n=1 Tax=Purpureocillium lilacinum TaxID=33203 RepID=A0A2U3DV51_PURLI|nr:hypothetical protein PCL_05354 [Purpureocillium lilacinum]